MGDQQKFMFTIGSGVQRRARLSIVLQESTISPPIRLSYFGGGHYDSIVSPETHRHHLTLEPEVHEQARLDLSAMRAAQNAASTNIRNIPAHPPLARELSLEERQLSAILALSRAAHAKRDPKSQDRNSLDNFISSQLDAIEQSRVQQAIQVSQQTLQAQTQMNPNSRACPVCTHINEVEATQCQGCSARLPSNNPAPYEAPR